MTSLFHAKLVLPKMLCLQTGDTVESGKATIVACPTTGAHLC